MRCYYLEPRKTSVDEATRCALMLETVNGRLNANAIMVEGMQRAGSGDYSGVAIYNNGRALHDQYEREARKYRL